MSDKPKLRKPPVIDRDKAREFIQGAAPANDDSKRASYQNSKRSNE